MNLNELKPAPGATHSRKRVGRGPGSGHGTYSGRGIKGQKARAGGTRPPRFEGGQLPLVQRLPHKRGFVNRFRVELTPVNLDRLGRFTPGQEVTPVVLAQTGIIKSGGELVKILGSGEITKALIVRAHRFSASARAKIEAVGGTVVIIGGADGDSSGEGN